MISKIIEVGDIFPELPNIFPTSNISHLSFNDLDKIEQTFKDADVKLCVINSNPFNGRTPDLINKIRKYYDGCMITLVGEQEVHLCQPIIQAGSSDILFYKNLTRDNIINLMLIYNRKNKAQKTLQDIKDGISELNKS